MSEDKIGCLLSLIFFVVVIAISVFLTKAIWEADIPVWLKFLLLK